MGRSTVLVQRIFAFIRQHQMVERGDKVIVGISGGADSVCLLFVLMELRRELEFELAGVHVNHGLRGLEARQDEKYVKSLCRTCGIPCLCYQYDVKERAVRERLSLEEAGRKCRYEAFEQAALELGANRIAVAHHRNDQAETVLFHLFRGSGLKGLAGMEPVRGRLIRPLLDTGRKEIEAWLDARGIFYCTDKTNLEAAYSRNKLRLTVLPYVEQEINSRAVEHIAAAGQELAETEQYLEAETEKAVRLCVREDEKGLLIFRNSFQTLALLIQRRLVRSCIEKTGGGLRDVGRIHIEAVCALMKQPVGKALDLPLGIVVRSRYEGLYLSGGSSESEKEGQQAGRETLLPAPVAVEVPGAYEIGGRRWSFSLEEGKKSKRIPEKTYTKWFDYDRIKECLVIRSRQPGDYLEINQEHSRKKLKDYLIDCKVPRDERAYIPVLADGSHILWVSGYRISEAYKVTDDTKRILKVQVDGGNGNGGEDKSNDSGTGSGCEDRGTGKENQ